MKSTLIGKLALGLSLGFSVLCFGGGDDRPKVEPDCYSEITKMRLNLMIENMRYVDALDGGADPTHDSSDKLAEFADDLQLMTVSMFGNDRMRAKLEESYVRMMFHHLEALFREGNELVAGDPTEKARHRAAQIFYALAAVVTPEGEFKDPIMVAMAPRNRASKATSLLTKIPGAMEIFSEFTYADSRLSLDARMGLLRGIAKMDDADLERRLVLVQTRMGLGELEFAERALQLLGIRINLQVALERLAGEMTSRDGNVDTTPLLKNVSGGKLAWAKTRILELRTELAQIRAGE